MATTSMTKAKGLYTFSNYLSAIPEGSLFEADNVVIDRDGIIEPRRGIKVLGSLPDLAKQLLTYKDQILAHYGDAIAYSDGNDPATFTTFKGKTDFLPSNVDTTANTITINQHGINADDEIVFTSTGTLPAPLVSGTTYFVINPTANTFQVSLTSSGTAINLTTQGSGTHTGTYDFIFTEVDANLRIKAIELNSNLYVTTNDGIKKIYGLSPLYVTTAGGFRALDVNLSLDLTTDTGFLPDDNEVAYRVTWGTKDLNGNLIEGFPSNRVVIQNKTGNSRNVTVSFNPPQGVTLDYFYRIYRTNVAIFDGSGDEQKLVYEAPYDGSATITVLDQQPEELRNTGVPLYTNEFTGEGINQANARPPVAKDIAIYQNTAFFANTRTSHQTTVTLLGQDGLTMLGVTSIVGSSPATVTTTTDHGLSTGHKIVLVGAGAADGTYEITVTGSNTFTIDSVAATGTDVRNIFTSSITIDKGTISNTYYFVGRPELTQITYQSKASTTDGSYFLINSSEDAIKYFVWFDKTGATATPVGADTVGRVGLKVDISSGAITTAADVAAAVKTALEATDDFTVGSYTTSHVVTTANSGKVAGTSSVPGLVTPFASPTDISVTQEGFGEDATNGYARLSSLISPALRIEDTAKSLVRVINSNTNDVVTGYYTPDVSELPGTMLFESKTVDTTPFTFIADSSTTGAMFNPDLTTAQSSSNEVYPNRLYFSKTQQPEAVPLTNSIDVGPRDKAILRILGLRDSLFILKEEGIYRLTGTNFTDFQVAMFDNSANLVAPDTACILNNQIYGLTSQGVASISETGVGIISRPIENFFNRVNSPSFTTSSYASFAFAYEADRAYLLFTPDEATDTYATRCYRYNTFTQCWTRWEKDAQCGIVETSSNKLYIGPPDIAAVEVERKSLTTRDYADREFTRQVSNYNSGLIYIDSTTNIVKGDMLTQGQYVTPGIYNRLVRKLKTDPVLDFDSDFEEITELGTNLVQKMIDVVTELNVSDTTLITKTFDASTDVDTGTDTITINNHGLLNGDAVKFTGASLPAPISENSYYFVVGATTNTFQLSLTEGGSVLNITAVGSGSASVQEQYYYSGSSDFETIQEDFNYNIDKLNASAGAFWSDYQESTGVEYIDMLISTVVRQGNKVTSANAPIFFLGEFTHYKAIPSTIVWAYSAFGEPSVMKHIRQGTVLLESVTLNSATVGYASDLSGNFEDTTFGLDGQGTWGGGIFNNVVWGGEGIAWPLRTLIPRQKQRCRYIKCRFMHSNAMYKYAILGISYTLEVNSERGYR